MTLHNRIKKLEQEADNAARRPRRDYRKTDEAKESQAERMIAALTVLDGLDLLTPQALLPSWNPDDADNQAEWQEIKAYIEAVGLSPGEPLAVVVGDSDDDDDDDFA